MERTVKILNISISNITYSSAESSTLSKAINREHGFLCFANAHMAVESLTNEELATGLKQADLVLADGFPIAKSMKLIYGINQDRIAGMDFLPTMLKMSNKYSLKIFIVGTTQEVLEMVEHKISKEFPQVTIAGSISPPFNEDWDNDKYVEIINKSKPNMVFVSLGCPKQEIWMGNNYHRISAPLLGIGGALIVYAGVLKRAPIFVQKFGFEWFYRLLQEPGRLWKRYLYTNTMFLFHIFKQWINMKLRT